MGAKRSCGSESAIPSLAGTGGGAARCCRNCAGGEPGRGGRSSVSATCACLPRTTAERPVWLPLIVGVSLRAHERAERRRQGRGGSGDWGQQEGVLFAPDTASADDQALIVDGFGGDQVPSGIGRDQGVEVQHFAPCIEEGMGAL